jgi:Cu(I)/Ag(I) efflux system membrane fusion protein
MKNILIVIVAVCCLITGVFIGKALFQGASEEEHAHEEETIWTCSMHPSVRSDEFGLCPICRMDLIPADQAGGSETEGVSLSAEALALAGIRTEVVGISGFSNNINLPGKIAMDESREAVQTAHIGGRIEALYVDFEGEQIEKGQLIADIYSPELLSAQEELLQAKKYKDTNPVLFESAKQKLKNWKLTDDQINSILESGQPQSTFPILADVKGIVKERYVNLGDHVMTGAPMFRVNDLSVVWAIFDAYERQLGSIEEGEEINFTANAFPGKSFSGVIDFIDPVIDPATRTVKIRATVVNPDGKIKPEMFIEGHLEGVTPTTEVLTIPRTAVLWTGKRSVVYVKKGGDTGPVFVLREIKIGSMGNEKVEVLSGLNVGEEVVVEGAFTIDAATELAGKKSMMTMDYSPVYEVSDSEIEAFQPVLSSYLKLKDSLVASNFEASNQHFSEMREAWENLPSMSGLDEKAWNTFSSEFEKLLEQGTAAKNLESLRTVFKPLSAAMIKAVDQFGLTSEPLYVQYCPMADDNQGADWISSSPLIRNPYYGDQMLKCGSVSKQINQ